MLTFSRRIASRLPSFSRCTGCTFTTSATVGCVSSLSRAISPVWFMPISTTHKRGSRAGIAQRQRHAPEIIETARAGIGVRIGGEKFLGAGLAGAAGQPDHRTLEPRPRRARQSPETIDQRILDDQLGNADAFDLVRDDHRHRTGGFRLVGEFPAVARAGETGNEAAARRAAERHEQASGLYEAAVLRDEIDSPFPEKSRPGPAPLLLRQSSTMAQRSCQSSPRVRPPPRRDR